jgi:hypothetical protein
MAVSSWWHEAVYGGGRRPGAHRRVSAAMANLAGDGRREGMNRRYVFAKRGPGATFW